MLAILLYFVLQLAVSLPIVQPIEEVHKVGVVYICIQCLSWHYKLLRIFKIFVQEVEKKVASAHIVRGVHCYLAKEIAYVGVFYNKGSKSVPEVVQGKETFAFDVGALVVWLYEGSAKFYGVGEIVSLEGLREGEELVGGHLLRLQSAAAVDISVSANYLLILGVPYNKLAVGLKRVHVILVYINRFACASAAHPEGYLP